MYKIYSKYIVFYIIYKYALKYILNKNIFIYLYTNI